MRDCGGQRPKQKTAPLLWSREAAIIDEIDLWTLGLQVRPALIGLDHANMTGGHAVDLRQHTAWPVALPNLADVLGPQLCVAVAPAPRLSSLAIPISDVVSLRANPQVVGVDAGRIIARMADNLTIGLPAIDSNGNPVCTVLLALEAEASVSVLVCISLPDPALVWSSLLYFRPESSGIPAGNGLLIYICLVNSVIICVHEKGALELTSSVQRPLAGLSFVPRGRRSLGRSFPDVRKQVSDHQPRLESFLWSLRLPPRRSREAPRTRGELLS